MRHIRLIGDIIGLEEEITAHRDINRAFPFIRSAGIGRGKRREAKRDIENAREAFRALDIAREPEKIVGGPGQHDETSPYACDWVCDCVARMGSALSSITQVSLVPPP